MLKRALMVMLASAMLLGCSAATAKELSLSQIYTGDAYTLNYPKGWRAHSQGPIVTLEGGDVYVRLSYPGSNIKALENREIFEEYCDMISSVFAHAGFGSKGTYEVRNITWLGDDAPFSGHMEIVGKAFGRDIAVLVCFFDVNGRVLAMQGVIDDDLKGYNTVYKDAFLAMAQTLKAK